MREGLDGTPIVLRLGVPPGLARTLHSTNSIESMISICREHAGNVKRWRDGQMRAALVRRWGDQGLQAVPPVNGHLHLCALRAALNRATAEPVVLRHAQCRSGERSLMFTGPPPKFHGTSAILIEVSELTLTLVSG
ncbi:hypothetical protein MSZK_39780 [Mycobacterium sp. shizuoka-1]|nr:hypothetical protein MSZK_39780 [Mycobacterium sp. shizuoka-1]